MRCDAIVMSDKGGGAMRSQCPTGGGGDRNIRIIDADSSFGGPAGGPDSDLGGRWPPRAPPLAPPLFLPVPRENHVFVPLFKLDHAWTLLELHTQSVPQPHSTN